MEHQGLLFIPDISGFTRFVNESEISHSRHIIQELLEVLINANNTGLEISEIEGDAILFYRFGAPLNMQELYRQVAAMFCAFHRHLLSYEHRRLCQCKACTAAINLSLKVITHYGEFTTYNVKNFSKLIGRDIIVAHQLLKNDIDSHEYWLVTQPLVPQGPPPELEWNSSAKKTEQGEIPFLYTQLGRLKTALPAALSPQLEITDKKKMVSVSREFETDIKKMYYTTVHYEFRPDWQVGVKAIDEVEHFLPGVGTRHRRTLDNGTVIMLSSSFSYDPEHRIVFSETDERRKNAVYFILEKISPTRTRFTLEYYIADNPVSTLLFKWRKQQQTEAQFRQSMDRLEVLLEKTEAPAF